MSVDTHKAVKALMGVGFNEAQAETLIETVGEAHDAIASKGDLEILGQQTKADLEVLGQQTKADLEAFGQQTKASLLALEQAINERATKTDLQALELSTEAKLRESELRMTIRLGTMIFAASGLIIAILKLFP
jgi:hypothetical protein